MNMMVEQTIYQNSKKLPVKFWTLSPGTLSILSNILYKDNEFKFLCKKLYINNLQFEESKEKEIITIDERYIIYCGRLIDIKTLKIIMNDVIDYKTYNFGGVLYYIKTKDNKWFAFGDNDCGQLGVDLESIYIYKPEPIAFGGVIDEFKFYGYSIYIRSGKKWFAFGDNQFGYLGVDSQNEKIYKPEPIVLKVL